MAPKFAAVTPNEERAPSAAQNAVLPAAARRSPAAIVALTAVCAQCAAQNVVLPRVVQSAEFPREAAALLALAGEAPASAVTVVDPPGLAAIPRCCRDSQEQSCAPVSVSLSPSRAAVAWAMRLEPPGSVVLPRNEANPSLESRPNHVRCFRHY